MRIHQSQNKRKKGLMLAALSLAGLLMGAPAAQANNYGNEIDIDAMKTLETSSAFPVKVTEKKVVEECLDGENIGDLSDVLSITITNESDAVVTALTLKYVAHDADQKTVDIQSYGLTVSLNIGDPELYAVTKEDLQLAPGASVTISAKVDWERFTGVRAMVQTYTDETGETFVNPEYAAWETLAFGLAAGNVTELD